MAHDWLENPDIKVIMGIGRLTYQKDFPTLIKAFARVRQKINSRLVILGEGRQRKELEYFINDLGLTDDVQLPGFVTNPYQWLAKSTLFVLSSRWEGSPNALTEALALGIPVVSTDCRSGPREILRGGQLGRLVPVGDVMALSEAIIMTLDDPPSAELLKQSVQHFKSEGSARGYIEALGLNVGLSRT
jgi:glycosyltransferase involved in cell wall biosynthesis